MGYNSKVTKLFSQYCQVNRQLVNHKKLIAEQSTQAQASSD